MTRRLRTVSLAMGALLFCCAVAQPIESANLQTQNSNNPELTEAATLSAAVVQLFREGKYKEALPLAKRALEIREKVLSPPDDQLTSSQRNLAEVYVALGKYGDAKELFERVRKSLEQSAADQPSLAEILERLAVVQFAMGSSVKTEELYKRALAINEKALGVEHPKVARLVSYWPSSTNLKESSRRPNRCIRACSPLEKRVRRRRLLQICEKQQTDMAVSFASSSEKTRPAS